MTVIANESPDTHTTYPTQHDEGDVNRQFQWENATPLLSTRACY